MDMIVSLVVVILATLIATYTDLKKREVPDFISYFLIIFGIMSNLLISILTHSYTPIIYSIVGASVFYIFGAILYYTGMWGGGDAKLLTGFGAIFATFNALVLWPFMISIWFNIMFWGVIIGLIWSTILAIKHKKEFIPETRKLLKKYRKIILMLYILFIFVIVSILFEKSYIITISWGFSVILFYLTIGLKAIENTCMYRFAKPKDLVEGDWISENVNVKNKLIYKPKPIGVELSDIKKMQSLEQLGKLKLVKIKDGLPYVPAFLLGLITTLLNIDILYLIFSRLI